MPADARFGFWRQMIFGNEGGDLMAVAAPGVGE